MTVSLRSEHSMCETAMLQEHSLPMLGHGKYEAVYDNNKTNTLNYGRRAVGKEMDLGCTIHYKI